MISVGDKVLITTDAWFRAPDGIAYNSVFGTVKGVFGDVDTLGIKTNAKSTNWYAEVGNLTIAGCQMHYVIKCDSVVFGTVSDFREIDGVIKTFDRPSYIYNADQ